MNRTRAQYTCYLLGLITRISHASFSTSARGSRILQPVYSIQQAEWQNFLVCKFITTTMQLVDSLTYVALLLAHHSQQPHVAEASCDMNSPIAYSQTTELLLRYCLFFVLYLTRSYLTSIDPDCLIVASHDNDNNDDNNPDQ